MKIERTGAELSVVVRFRSNSQAPKINAPDAWRLYGLTVTCTRHRHQTLSIEPPCQQGPASAPLVWVLLVIALTRDIIDRLAALPAPALAHLALPLVAPELECPLTVIHRVMSSLF